MALPRSPSRKSISRLLAATALRPRLIPVPAGRYRCGSEPEERHRWLDETPHEILLSTPLWMAQTPVTQAQYERVMGHNPAAFPGDLRRPLENVSFREALEYCNQLSIAEGLLPCYDCDERGVSWATRPGDPQSGYRLPTEAEWEHAARAGRPATGPAGPSLADCAWYADNAQGRTQPVRSKDHNAWGLYDMLGNVFEWVWDAYVPYLGRAVVIDPGVPAPLPHQDANEAGLGAVAQPRIERNRIAWATEHAVRGGAWSSAASTVRLSHRLAVPGSWKRNFIGFRIVRPWLLAA